MSHVIAFEASVRSGARFGTAPAPALGERRRATFPMGRDPTVEEIDPWEGRTFGERWHRR